MVATLLAFSQYDIDNAKWLIPLIITALLSFWAVIAIAKKVID